MKKIVSAAMGIFLVVVAVFCVMYFGSNRHSGPFVLPKGTVPLRISAETTIVTEPLLPDGTVDFCAVLDNLCSINADSEGNGFRTIVQLAGRSIFKDISDEEWKILCEKLNLPPDEPDKLYYLPLREFICGSLGKSEGKDPSEESIRSRAYQITFSFSNPEEVSAENLELLERWVTEMEPAINAVAEALKKPLYVLPPTGKFAFPKGFELPVSNLHIGDWPDFMTAAWVHREIANMFSYRCRFRQIKNDGRGWDDVLSLFR
ncbi:MAG: hypothetical protein FWE67_10810, partial [Planctomycetaceae bacterium]|nr:hypothetical protein [Planctomycetaceae bacterium]